MSPTKQGVERGLHFNTDLKINVKYIIMVVISATLPEVFELAGTERCPRPTATTYPLRQKSPSMSALRMIENFRF
jgi:hypothetical protein